MATHPGFKKAEAKIGKQPGIRNPGAVLAAGTRKASPAAKKANPRLKKVKPAKPMHEQMAEQMSGGSY
jgi:hypothetical protein